MTICPIKTHYEVNSVFVYEYFGSDLVDSFMVNLTFRASFCNVHSPSRCLRLGLNVVKILTCAKQISIGQRLSEHETYDLSAIKEDLSASGYSKRMSASFPLKPDLTSGNSRKRLRFINGALS